MKHYWLMIALCAVAGCVSAGSEPAPKLGKNLPSSIAEARPAFDRQVKTRFPIGSEERVLLNELRIEGFTIISTNPAIASFTAHQLGCNLHYFVQWSAENRKIACIGGDYGASCL
jgi:hypothetical protein